MSRKVIEIVESSQPERSNNADSSPAESLRVPPVSMRLPDGTVVADVYDTRVLKELMHDIRWVLEAIRDFASTIPDLGRVVHHVFAEAEINPRVQRLTYTGITLILAGIRRNGIFHSPPQDGIACSYVEDEPGSRPRRVWIALETVFHALKIVNPERAKTDGIGTRSAWIQQGMMIPDETIQNLESTLKSLEICCKDSPVIEPKRKRTRKLTQRQHSAYRLALKHEFNITKAAQASGRDRKSLEDLVRRAIAILESSGNLSSEARRLWYARCRNRARPAAIDQRRNGKTLRPETQRDPEETEDSD